MTKPRSSLLICVARARVAECPRATRCDGKRERVAGLVVEQGKGEFPCIGVSAQLGERSRERQAQRVIVRSERREDRDRLGGPAVDQRDYGPDRLGLRSRHRRQSAPRLDEVTREQVHHHRLELELGAAERIGEVRDRGRDLRERTLERSALYDHAQRPDHARGMQERGDTD